MGLELVVGIEVFGYVVKDIIGYLVFFKFMCKYVVYFIFVYFLSFLYLIIMLFVVLIF